MNQIPNRKAGKKECKTERNPKKIDISLGVFLYILYTLFIWFADFEDLICYFAGVPQKTVISRILAALLIVVLFNIAKDFFCVKWNKPSLLECTGMLILAVFGLMKTIYPDSSYDTTLYHLILQQSEFSGIFSQGFAKGHIAFAFFHIGDKMFYPFRMLLGYRMGTILNTIVLVLIYRQIVELLKNCLQHVDEKNKQKYNYFSCVRSFGRYLLLWASRHY